MKNPRTRPSGKTKLWEGTAPVSEPAPRPRVETPADVERKEQEARLAPWPKLPWQGKEMQYGRIPDDVKRRWDEIGIKRRSNQK